MMQFNWGEKDRLIYMDLETQSALNIKKEGAKQYLESATTRLLSAVFLTGDELLVWAPKSRLPRGYDYSAEDASGYRVSIDTGEDCPESIRQRISDGYTFVAHNAETFDAIAWARFCPDVSANWIDTLHLCRLYGYPGSLDGASKAMGGSGKSDATAMKLLTTARIVGSNLVYPVGTAPLWDALIAYNIKDVLELKRIAGEVLFRDRYREDAILHRSTEINQRGVKIDVEYVRKLRDVWQLMQNESYDEISRLTGGKLDATNIRSPKQVKGYLESLGFFVPNNSLNSAVINQILNDPEKYIDECGNGAEDDARRAIALLAERQNATRNTVGKLAKVFDVLDGDGCVRNIIQYHGAGTGRFSGRYLQPHNFARGFLNGAQTAALVNHIKGSGTPASSFDLVKRFAARTEHPNIKGKNLTPSDVLSGLTRSIIKAREGKCLVPIDYAAIEARGIAWVARCKRAINTFSDPKGDIYCDMASSLYGRNITKRDKAERFVGKSIVLGCGYQMGAEKFGASCKMFLIDLDKANTNAVECVKKYRETYPEIQQVWREYDHAAKSVVSNPRLECVAGRCLFFYRDAFLHIQLPSGRCLRYRNCRITHKAAKWNPTGPAVPHVTYDTPYGFSRDLYGGIIAENVVQAISRDILCHHMVEIGEGTPIVLHVHDEIVFEVPMEQKQNALYVLGKAMVKPPVWAADFPVACEGFTTQHYSKQCWPKETEAKFHVAG
jgi:DNA polymerase